MKTKEKAMRLACRAGYIGVHKFYLKEWLWGIIYVFYGLIICLTSILMLVSRPIWSFSLFTLWYLVSSLRDFHKIKKIDEDAFDKKYNPELYMERTQKYLEEIEKEFELKGLQEINSSLSLPSGEKCYYMVDNVEWKEPRQITTSISYSGINKRITLGKGLSFRMGSISPVRHTATAYQIIESGTLYVTDKKIFLSGTHGAKNIPLSKILDIQSFGDGILIQRETGKNVVFPLNLEDHFKIRLIINKIKE